MPLTLSTPTLLNRSRHLNNISHPEPNNTVINITARASSHDVNITNIPTEVLINTPELSYFDNATWTLNLILPSLLESCININIGLVQTPKQWPHGHTCTVNFLDHNKNIIATNLIAGQSTQFIKFLVAADGTRKITIHKQEYTPLTILSN